MKSGWLITHDPLRPVANRGAIAHLEDAAREQGEDIIQTERSGPEGKKKILDLGWYRDRYLVILTENDWARPIIKLEARDLESAMLIFRSYLNEPN
jgi:hypothetical protein